MKTGGFMHNFKCFLIFILVLFTISTLHAMVFPGADWAGATPESQGVNSAKLTTAINYLKSKCGSNGVTELVVIRNGYMIWKGGNIDRKHGVWSCTKSFTSTVLGLLVDDAKCTADALAINHLPAIGSQYSQVKLRHFATHASGYRASGDGNGVTGSHGQSSTPFSPIAPLFAPGTHFLYWDSAMNMYANVLTRIANEPIHDLFKRRIADLIGMDDAKWDWGDFGIINGILVNGGAGNKSNDIKISAREMARFCHLLLNRGNWDGTLLISCSWVDKYSQVQVPNTIPNFNDNMLPGSGVYSYNFWVNSIKRGGGRLMPDAPHSLYMAMGYANNYGCIIPEWDMVVVRLGTDGGGTDETPVYNEFFRLLGLALDSNPVKLGSSGKSKGRIGLDVYPNPFRTSVDIEAKFKIENLKFEIFNLKGQQVYASYVAQHTPHVWDASNQPTGTYVIKAQTGTYEISRTVTLIK
jgi:CubicO group peptidase (beta-lactamase class C family)